MREDAACPGVCLIPEEWVVSRKRDLQRKTLSRGLELQLKLLPLFAL